MPKFHIPDLRVISVSAVGFPLPEAQLPRSSEAFCTAHAAAGQPDQQSPWKHQAAGIWSTLGLCRAPLKPQLCSDPKWESQHQCQPLPCASFFSFPMTSRSRHSTQPYTYPPPTNARPPCPYLWSSHSPPHCICPPRASLLLPPWICSSSSSSVLLFLNPSPTISGPRAVIPQSPARFP